MTKVQIPEPAPIVSNDLIIQKINSYLKGDKDKNSFPETSKHIADVLKVKPNYLASLESRLKKLVDCGEDFQKFKELLLHSLKLEEVDFLYENETYLKLLKAKGLDIKLALFYPSILNKILDNPHNIDFWDYAKKNKNLSITNVMNSNTPCLLEIHFDKDIQISKIPNNTLNDELNALIEKLLLTPTPAIKKKFTSSTLTLLGKKSPKLAYTIWNDETLKANLPFSQKFSNNTLGSIMAGVIVGYIGGLLYLYCSMGSIIKNDIIKEMNERDSMLQKIGFFLFAVLLVVNVTLLGFLCALGATVIGILIGIQAGNLAGISAGILSALLLHPIVIPPLRERVIDGVTLGMKGLGFLMEHWNELLFSPKDIHPAPNFGTIKEIATDYSKKNHLDDRQEPNNNGIRKIIGFFKSKPEPLLLPTSEPYTPAPV
ncbi:MAG: hypothetical protein QM652_01035 [Legionella sp.]|uniref:hypothetical protein n=1 Tax=Legionella sp. TaxID=459 RepID=UPI0039E5D949